MATTSTIKSLKRAALTLDTLWGVAARERPVEDRVKRALTLVLAAILALTSVSLAHAAPDAEALTSAALTAEETGPGFTLAQSGPVDQLTEQGLASYMAAYQKAPRLRNPGLEMVAVILLDARGVDTGGDLTSLAGVEDLAMIQQFGFTLSPATAPAIGENTAMFTISGQILGQQINGDLVVWQQGEVIALTMALGTTSPSSLGYAEAQRAKLASAGF